MSNRKGLFDRALGLLGLSENPELENPLFYRNGVYKPDLKRLHAAAMVITKLSVNLAQSNGMSQRTGPYDSATTVFVDRLGFEDVRSECCSNIPEYFTGFVVRNKVLAGQLIRFTLSAGVPYSLHLGTHDPNRPDSLIYTDKLTFDPSEPYLAHENAALMSMLSDYDAIVPNRETIARVDANISGMINVTSANLCGVDELGPLIL